jgi:hypothetical protein
MGNSREPPDISRFWWHTPRHESREVYLHVPKRLPSRLALPGSLKRFRLQELLQEIDTNGHTLRDASLEGSRFGTYL